MALQSAQDGSLDVFQATVDCQSISWQQRNVTFRRTAGGVFVTDYLTLTLATSGTLDGTVPIDVTLQRGSTGPSQVATLTKQGELWISGDGALTLTFVESSSSDGVRGITATVTSSVLGVTGYVVEAIAGTAPVGSSGSTYSSSSVSGAGNSNDRGGPIGQLHPAYVTVVSSDIDESVTSLVIEVEGPQAIIDWSGFKLPTKTGDRKLASKNGKRYLATANGAEPETLIFVNNDSIPAGDEKPPEPTPPDPNEDPGENGPAAYLKGYIAGAVGGGAALVSSNLEVVATVNEWMNLPENLLLSWASDEAANRAMDTIAGGVETASVVADVAKNVAKNVAVLLQKVKADKDAFYRAMFNHDRRERDRILGEYAIYADIAGEFIGELSDEYELLDDYHKGVVAGRIFFEVALIIAPLLKGAQVAEGANAAKLGSVSRIGTLRTLIRRLGNVKWAKDFKLNIQGALSRACDRLRLFVDGAKRMGWVSRGKYGRDGEQIYTLSYWAMKKDGLSPVQAVAFAEKDYPLLNPKALSAAYLDAIVEQTGVNYVVRADGARIVEYSPETNNTYFWSGLGRGGALKAKTIVEQRGGKTLEMLNDDKNISDTIPEWKKDVPARKLVWDGLSEQLAKEATGKVRVVLGVENPDSTWMRVELRALKENPRVTGIWRVNPETGEETLYWSPGVP